MVIYSKRHCGGIGCGQRPVVRATDRNSSEPRMVELGADKSEEKIRKKDIE